MILSWNLASNQRFFGLCVDGEGENQLNGALQTAVLADEAVERSAVWYERLIHGAAATPTPLIEAMCRRQDLTDVKLYHMHTEGPAPFLNADCENQVASNITVLDNRSVKQ